mgnify:CR=1 FL=1
MFRKNREQIKKLAVDGAALLRKLAEETEGNFTFEYSPDQVSHKRHNVHISGTLPVAEQRPHHTVSPGQHAALRIADSGTAVIVRMHAEHNGSAAVQMLVDILF